MINWWIKRHKKKRLSKLPRLRRLFEHQVEPLVDVLYMKHQIHSYEIKRAVGGIETPETIRGKALEVLYYSRFQCEVRLLWELEATSMYVQTNHLEFSPTEIENKDRLSEGEYVQLNVEIKSDDELRGNLGEKGEKLLIIKNEKDHKYPLWAYNEETKEAFRVSENEVNRLHTRIPVEIII